MVRSAVLVALVVAGCSSDAAKPERHAKSVTRRVVPPAVRGPIYPLGTGVVLDDGDELYEVPPLDPLRGGSLPDGVPVPGRDRAIAPAQLRYRGTIGPLPVVMARATRSDRVHAIVDALPVGACFIPVVTRDGFVGQLHGNCALRRGEGIVNLTITVTPERFYVGLSLIAEFRIVERAGTSADLSAVETILREHKISAFFSDRHDIEIFGDRVVYGDVIDAAQLAIRTGFTDVTIVSPRTVSARPAL